MQKMFEKKTSGKGSASSTVKSAGKAKAKMPLSGKAGKAGKNMTAKMAKKNGYKVG